MARLLLLVIEDTIGGTKQILWNIDSQEEIRVERGYQLPHVSRAIAPSNWVPYDREDHGNIPYRQHLISIQTTRVYATCKAYS
jgi:hypothetical protein